MVEVEEHDELRVKDQKHKEFQEGRIQRSSDIINIQSVRRERLRVRLYIL